MKCPKCQTENPPDNQFCANCGIKLPTVINPTSATPPATSNNINVLPTSNPDKNQLLTPIPSTFLGKIGWILDLFEKYLDLYLAKKAPSLPHWLKSLLANLFPWWELVLNAIAIGSIIVILFGVEPFSSRLHPNSLLWLHQSGLSFWWGAIHDLIIFSLSIPAILLLFKKSIKGWRLMFYLTIINMVFDIFTAPSQVYIQNQVYLFFNLFLTVILDLYPLFQIRELYS